MPVNTKYFDFSDVFPTAQAAYNLALSYFKDQKRKGGIDSPMDHIHDILHLIDEADMSWNEPLVAAAICHDLLEDTECTQEEIYSACGSQVLSTVQLVTADSTITDNMARKRQYLAMATSSYTSALVCLFDKVANMQKLRDLLLCKGESAWDSFNLSKHEKMIFEWECYHVLRTNLPESAPINNVLLQYADLLLSIYFTPQHYV